MLLGKESPFTEYRAGVSNVAAILLEPMQASAGYIIPGEGYLRGIRDMCDEFGFLFIDDEIQAGMGRTGRFWACEHEQVVPDMILVSKGLASGLPVSAVIADDEVAASWGPGAHVGTFAATALACAAANATLDVYESEHLVKRAAELGDYFRDQLGGLQERHPILGWIDNRGLFTGLEFVRDRATKEPAVDEAAWMLEFCVREGLLFEKGGYYYNRFQLIPSLVMEKELIDRAVDILDRAMSMTEARSGLNAG
jgi:4-aminobutyrate aminotransferase-like enzyme